MDQTTKELTTTWRALSAILKLDESKGFLADLLPRYDESHRKYHNKKHILDVIDQIYVLGDLVELTNEDLWLAILAAFYHDAVYVPGFAYNEILSAEMARAHLNCMGLPAADINKIIFAILATQKHESDQLIDQVLIDADLYGLGTTNYVSNGVQVRREFGIENPNDPKWVAGRRKFLISFLERPRIYLLPHQEGLEVAARRHMKNELADLGGCPNDTDDDGDCGRQYCPWCGSD